MLKIVMAAAGLSLVAVPVVAQATSIETARPAAKSKDPNRIVCEREDTTGTRLGSRKICLTAAQWQEKRREHREELERAQKNVGILNGQ